MRTFAIKIFLAIQAGVFSGCFETSDNEIFISELFKKWKKESFCIVCVWSYRLEVYEFKQNGILYYDLCLNDQQSCGIKINPQPRDSFYLVDTKLYVNNQHRGTITRIFPSGDQVSIDGKYLWNKYEITRLDKDLFSFRYLDCSDSIFCTNENPITFQRFNDQKLLPNNALEPSTPPSRRLQVLRGLSFPSANAAPVAPSPLLLRRRGFGRGLRLSAALGGQ